MKVQNNIFVCSPSNVTSNNNLGFPKDKDSSTFYITTRHFLSQYKQMQIQMTAVRLYILHVPFWWCSWKIRSHLPKQEEIFIHWPQEQHKHKHLLTRITYAKISSKTDITNVFLENDPYCIFYISTVSLVDSVLRETEPLESVWMNRKDKILLTLYTNVNLSSLSCIWEQWVSAMENLLDQ